MHGKLSDVDGQQGQSGPASLTIFVRVLTCQLSGLDGQQGEPGGASVILGPKDSAPHPGQVVKHRDDGEQPALEAHEGVRGDIAAAVVAQVLVQHAPLDQVLVARIGPANTQRVT